MLRWHHVSLGHDAAQLFVVPLVALCVFLTDRSLQDGAHELAHRLGRLSGVGGPDCIVDAGVEVPHRAGVALALLNVVGCFLQESLPCLERLRELLLEVVLVKVHLRQHLVERGSHHHGLLTHGHREHAVGLLGHLLLHRVSEDAQHLLELLGLQAEGVHLLLILGPLSLGGPHQGIGDGVRRPGRTLALLSLQLI